MKTIILLCPLLISTASLAGSPLSNAHWRMDMAQSSNLQVEGQVTLDVPLNDEERRQSLTRGGDGLVADFSGGVARVQNPPRLNMGKDGLTWAVRIKPRQGLPDGGLFIGARLPLNVELAAWHIPWGDRWNLGYFQSTPGRVAHAPFKEKQDTGWLDIVVRVHPPSFQPPKPVTKTFAGWTEIFVNGQLRVRRPYTGPNSGYTPQSVTGLVLGRDWNDRRFHGWMDHLAVWLRVLADAEVAALSGVETLDTSLPPETNISGWHQEVGEGFFPSGTPRKERLTWVRDHTVPTVVLLKERDPLLPRFHLTPPGSIYNTHVFYHEGLWHMFPAVMMGGAGFISNAEIFWMHLTSPDLLRWQPLTALMPQKDFNPNGAFYLDAAGRANVVAGGFKTFVTWAIAKDSSLEQWDIQPRPEISASSPAPKGRHDPAVFCHKGLWYMAATIIERKKTTARIHLYRSKDGSTWEYAKLLHEAEAGNGLQECLVAFMLPDDILVLSANKALVPGHTYIVGRFRDETFTLLGSGVSDYGHNAQSGEKRPYNMFHGSQTPEGRALVWQWQGLVAHPRDVTAKGWSSCYSLPRDMTLRRDHTLAFQPAAELEKLRGDLRDLISSPVDMSAASSPVKVPGSCELRVTMKPGVKSRCGWQIRQRGRGFAIVYDSSKQELIMSVDSAAAHRVYDGPFKAPCALSATGSVTLRLFLDRSMVEVYTPEGNVISSWVFFENPEKLELARFVETGSATLTTATLWPMNDLAWLQPAQEGTKP